VGATTLWVPSAATEEVLVCTLCSKAYGLHQRVAHEQHVVKCATSLHEEVIGEAIADKESSLFTSSGGPDPELAAYERNKR
jgi:hypothetical protein